VNTEQEYLEEIVPTNGTERGSGRPAPARATPRESIDHPPASGDLVSSRHAQAFSTLSGRRRHRE
jgi:hypothetical protein